MSEGKKTYIILKLKIFSCSAFTKDNEKDFPSVPALTKI